MLHKDALSLHAAAGDYTTQESLVVFTNGDEIRRTGNEFGSTTGRPRRCGWLDLVAVKYSADLNGITHLAITLLDVLSAVEEIKICVGYEIDGERVDEFPMSQTDLHHARPVYKELPGWGVDITRCRMRGDLPGAAQDFVGAAAGGGPGRSELQRPGWLELHGQRRLGGQAGGDLGLRRPRPSPTTSGPTPRATPRSLVMAEQFNASLKGESSISQLMY